MRINKYKSRFEAGEFLAKLIHNENKDVFNQITKTPENFLCYAIPNGGIPVAEGFCSIFKIIYDILIVRKIKIPFNTEAGFGALTPDGTVFFNDTLLNQLNLSKRQIKESVELTKSEISDRVKYYKKDINLQNQYMAIIQNKNIFIIDDGLASGFTMLAALSMVKKYNPKRISIAVPTAPLRTVKKIEDHVEQIYCPNIRNVMWFAVADAYINWYDVPESEALDIINSSKYYLKSKDLKKIE